MLRAARGLPEFRNIQNNVTEHRLIKMAFLQLAPLRYGNIASSTKCIAYLKLAFSYRGIGLFLFM